MEGYVDFYANFFLQYKRKFFILKDFILTICHYNEKENSFIKEKSFHVKYLRIEPCSDLNIKLGIQNYNDSIFFKLETEEDKLNWLDAIKSQKAKYEKFLDDYYNNNNSDKLFDESEDIYSFSDYFNYVKLFINDVEIGLEDVHIDSNLEAFLELLNSYITQFDFYTSEIDKFYYKLNSSNKDDLHIMNKSKEIKILFEELRESIVQSTYQLNSEDINLYINNFKKAVLDKTKQMNELIVELEYYIQNYSKMFLNIRDDSNGEENENLDFVLKRILLENEMIKIENNELAIQNEIMKHFMSLSDKYK
jgi:hypothetical protein